ncbi:MAG: DUF805 domain-containing protein [Clostridia bacterium]|nr:DUF805 domain-containing protein [Clostridia bacterium]
MFCKNCGKQLEDGALFCSECGTAIPASEKPVEPTVEPTIETQPLNDSAAAQPAAKPQDIDLVQAYRLFVANLLNFKGRATRPEYWWVFLINWLLTFLINLIPVLGALLSLIIIIPNLALTVRRLHDTGKSGWYAFISFIPIVGTVLLIIQLCKDSDGDNQWGLATK